MKLQESILYVKPDAGGRILSETARGRTLPVKSQEDVFLYKTAGRNIPCKVAKGVFLVKEAARERILWGLMIQRRGICRQHGVADS